MTLSPVLEASFNYLDERPAETPAFYVTAPLPEVPRKGPQLGPKTMPLHDARRLEPAPALDTEGVELVAAPSTFRQNGNFYDEAAVRGAYYSEIEDLVQSTTGARRVLAFDHNLRSRPLADAQAHGAQQPVTFAHNDYTEESGPQRVRDLLPDEAEDLMARRFAVINVWRPTRHPVEETPLAVCDAQSMGPNDLVSMDLLYTERVGQIQSLLYREDHRWLYYPDMTPDEAMLLKCYDSAQDGRARFTAHSAFEDPTTRDNPTPRESVEVRTLAFF
jgi:hypothetical protein